MIMTKIRSEMEEQDIVVRQSNALTTATYSLNMTEKRLIYLALREVNNANSDGTDIESYLESFTHGQYPVDVNHSEYVKLFQISKDSVARDIGRAVQSLEKKSIKIFDKEEDLGNERGFKSYSWTSGSHHRPKSGLTTILMSTATLSIIAKTDRRFTQFLIGEAGKLTNPYAARLYEAISQWLNTRSSLTLDLEWMFSRWQIPESYLRMSDFRRRVLRPIIKEINDKTTIRDLEAVEIKVSGKVKSIVFKWKANVKTKTTKELARIAISKITARKRPSEVEIGALKKELGTILSSGEGISAEVMEMLNNRYQTWEQYFDAVEEYVNSSGGTNCEVE